jgi:hypothetical protein
VRRRPVILLAAAVLTAGLAALALVDPLHLRYSDVYGAVLVLLAIVVGTVALVHALRGRAARVLTGVLGAVLAAGWAVLAWFAIQLTGPNRLVAEVEGTDRRLVVVENSAFAIDPTYAVLVRAGSGPLEQESLVWQGLAEGAAPSEVRFRDAAEVEVEVLLQPGCGYRSTVDPVTLTVDPVHRPIRLDGC